MMSVIAVPWHVDGQEGQCFALAFDRPHPHGLTSFRARFLILMTHVCSTQTQQRMPKSRLRMTRSVHQDRPEGHGHKWVLAGMATIPTQA